MMQGTVKFFDGKRGYGFIQPTDGGPDVFVHVTDLAGSGTILSEGQAVTFEVATCATAVEGCERSGGLKMKPRRLHIELQASVSAD